MDKDRTRCPVCRLMVPVVDGRLSPHPDPALAEQGVVSTCPGAQFVVVAA